jgi:adhesin transport system outer membrane protein
MKKLTLAIGLGLLVLPPAQAAQGLAAALQASLQHNPAVRGKSAEVSAQNYAVESAKAQRLPSFSADLNNVQGDFEREQASVRIQQPLWTFGKIDTAIHKAEAGVQTEELSLLQIKRQLIEKVAVAYARIQGIGRQERVASETIVEHQRLFRHISRRQKGQ